MPENLHADAQPGVASLAGGILEDAQKLIRQELALARREVSNAWDKAKTGAALIVSALPILVMGGILLVIMLVKLLHQYLLPDHEWACFGIVGGLLALLGGTLAVRGLKQINKIRLKLPQTIESLNHQSPLIGNGVSGGRPCTDTLETLGGPSWTRN